MRRLISLLAIASLAGMLFAQLLWGKEKCRTVCATVISPYCPFICSWNPWPDAECYHPYHPPVRRTGDVYLWQCVPCTTPEGALEPQYMQWGELKIYLCGVQCHEEFVTPKGAGDQEAIPVEPCLYL